MALVTNRSAELFDEALRYLAGGVNSPVRAFKAVDRHPLFIRSAHGSRLHDEDGNEFIDYVCSWGAAILGHAHPHVTCALQEAVQSGTSFGAPTEQETALAKLIVSAMPSIDLVRFVNSGTEATMSALRLARAFTGRAKIVKFAGCYHGHSDGLLAKAGSGVATMGLPDSPGVPPSYTQNTLIASYNDLQSVEALFSAFGEDIAAIIVEPVAANMGVIQPRQGFLEGLRKIASTTGALLVFDEVITGFRVALGGAQALYGIQPDLTCLGKIIGGGLPVGAYGGKRQVMEMLAPAGPVYQAGTLSGNPLAMTAGIATLTLLNRPNTYEPLEQAARTLEQRLAELLEASAVRAVPSRVGSLLTLFFTGQDVYDFDSALQADTRQYARFFNRMLEQGIYLAPSQFEAAFVSLAHTPADIAATLRAAEQALEQMGT